MKHNKLYNNIYPPDFIIEASFDGIHWMKQTSFNNGDNCRYDTPMDTKNILIEAASFKLIRTEFNHVRVIINL